MPSEPAQPGRGDHHGVQLARARPCRAGCRRCPGSARVEAEAERLELGDAPRRAGADRRPRAAARRALAVAGDQRVAGVLPRRDRGERQPGVGRGRQVLVGVHRDVDLAGDQRVAQLRDEHADAERGDRRRTSGRRAVLTVTSSTGWPAAAQPRGDQLGLGDGERAGPGAEPEGGGQRSPAGPRRGVSPTARRVDRDGRSGASPAREHVAAALHATAAGVCGSSSNSSRSAWA